MATGTATKPKADKKSKAQKKKIGEILDGIGKPVVIDPEEAAMTWHDMGDALKKAMEKDPNGKQVVMTEKLFPEMFNLMHRLMAENHGHLIDGQAEICLVWNTSPRYQSGKLSVGRCRKVSGIYRILTGFNFIIELDAGAWEKLVPILREAELDYQLSHAFCEERELDNQGRVGWFYKLRSPDVEEFTEVAKRYGPYRQSIRDLVDAVAPKKPDLFTEPAAEGEAKK